MIILFCSLLLIVLAGVMLFTHDYPDGVMGKLFMGMACIGAAIVVGSVVEAGHEYTISPEIAMIVTGLVLDKVRSLCRFFRNRARVRIDEIDEAKCPGLEQVKKDIAQMKQDATMFLKGVPRKRA